MFIQEVVLSDTQNCDCDNGMTQITLEYVGEKTASKIVGYYNGNKMSTSQLDDCEFSNVETGDTITCSAGSYGKFKGKTRFEVFYEGNEDDEADCSGDAKTKCKKMTIGKSIKNCDDLVVVSHVDGDGALCNVDIMEAQFSGEAMASNALTATGMTLNSPLRIWKELDPFIQYLLIGLFIAFTALIVVSCCICVFGKNRRRKTQSFDSVLNHIEMSMRDGHHHVPQETCGELEFDDELADHFDGYFEEEIESPTGYKSVSTEYVE